VRADLWLTKYQSGWLMSGGWWSYFLFVCCFFVYLFEKTGFPFPFFFAR